MEQPRTHAGENILNCRVCGERFARTLCLDAHIRTHRGEKLVTGCSPHTMSTRLSPWPVNLNRLDPARFDCVVQCAVIYAYSVDHDFYNVATGRIIWEHTLERT